MWHHIMLCIKSWGRVKAIVTCCFIFITKRFWKMGSIFQKISDLIFKVPLQYLWMNCSWVAYVCIFFFCFSLKTFHTDTFTHTFPVMGHICKHFTMKCHAKTQVPNVKIVVKPQMKVGMERFGNPYLWQLADSLDRKCIAVSDKSLQCVAEIWRC